MALLKTEPQFSESHHGVLGETKENQRQKKTHRFQAKRAVKKGVVNGCLTPGPKQDVK